MATISFAGLASGFNSTSYIEAVMKQESIPLTNLQTKQSNTKAFMNTFNDINTKLKTLKDAAFALKDKTVFQSTSATSSDSSKVSVTAGDSAFSGNYQVNIKNLAQQQVSISKDITSLNDLTGTLVIGDKTFDLDQLKSGETTLDSALKKVANAVNAAGIGINAAVVQKSANSRVITLTAAKSGSEGAFISSGLGINESSTSKELNSISDLTGSIKIGDKVFDLGSLVSAETTLDGALGKIADAINNENVGVNVAIITQPNGAKSLSFVPNKAVSIDDSSSLGIKRTQGLEAKDAMLSVNGIDIISSSNEIKNAAPGVTLQLNNVGSSTIKVSMDSDKVASKVDAFVKAYNDVINSIRDVTKKSEKTSSGALTLTLQGDATLRDLQSQLNNMMNNIVGSTSGYKLLGEIGLEVDKGVTSASLMTGNINFNKDKFKEKLVANPQALQSMFTNVTSEDSNGIPVSGIEGLGALFDGMLQDWTNSVDGIIASKIKGYKSDISYMDDQITSMQSRLDMREESLKKKYANLEVVMSGLNNQKDWISSQVAQMNKSSK